MDDTKARHESRAFLTILIGQLVSIVGTGLTNFAIGVWVFQRTGSVTKFATTMLAITLPSILIAPIAGALVDRWNHRLTMILADSASALCSAVLALLLYMNILQLWMAIVVIAIAAMVSVLHGLAYAASVPLLIPQKHLSRAVGAMQIGPAIAQVLSPALAGFLLSVVALQSVIMVDAASFVIAVVTLLLVHVPDSQASHEGQTGKGSLFKEALAGWSYIRVRGGLLWLLFFFTVSNFVMAMSNVVLTPMLLSLSSVRVVGTIASAASLGMLTGSILLSVWGGPRKRIYGVLIFNLLFSLFMMMLGVRPDPWLIGIAGFGFVFCVPIVDGCSQTIWLSKTPPDLQGRVLSVKQMVGWSVAPIAFLMAGPITDRVFEPAMSAHGALAGSIGTVIGTGKGRGMALVILLLGLSSLLVTLASLASRRVRSLEENLPDALPSEAAHAPLVEKSGGAVA